jgi:aryl-alcohol dehydrogenase-like predicted oxidoreductase
MAAEKNIDNNKPDRQLYNIPFQSETFNGMPFRPLGNSGLKVPHVGLGTWKIGYPETGDNSRVNEKTAFQIFDRAIETGVTFWDTANRYNNASGNSERVIGSWINKNPDQRRNVIVATKIGGAMDGTTPNHCGLSRGNILDSVYASLDRLQLDHIDLLYFHLFDTSIPIEESLLAIEDLIQQDLVRYFAISNFTVDQMNAYKAMEKKLSPRVRIVAVQNKFDILNGEQVHYKGVLENAFNAGISFIAWSPLARGLLTEKYLDVKNIGKGDRLFDEGEINAASDLSYSDILQQLGSLSPTWGMTLNQLAIAYMLTLPGMGPVIAACSDVKQLESNAAAGKIALTNEQRLQVKEVLEINKIM